VSGIVQQAPQRPGAPTNRNVMVKLGTAEDALEAVLPPNEQVPGEVYTPRQPAQVPDRRHRPRPARCVGDRLAHPPRPGARAVRARGPEIADGSVEIARSPARPGHRTKIAVRSSVQGLNAKGACIGPSAAASAT
jgi:N utilization substance protein A